MLWSVVGSTYTWIIVLESPTSPPSPMVNESYPISRSNSSKLIWITCWQMQMLSQAVRQSLQYIQYLGTFRTGYKIRHPGADLIHRIHIYWAQTDEHLKALLPNNPPPHLYAFHNIGTHFHNLPFEKMFQETVKLWTSSLHTKHLFNAIYVCIRRQQHAWSSKAVKA